MSSIPTVVSVRAYVLVLVALLSLTLATLLVSRLALSPRASWIAAAAFALAKAFLVLSVFMHLRWDHAVLRAALLGAISLVSVLFLLTYVDWGERPTDDESPRTLSSSVLHARQSEP